MHARSRTKGHAMSAAKTPRELIEAARIKYCWNATPANHQDLFHEYATTALSLLPSLFEAHDAEIAALKAAQPVELVTLESALQAIEHVSMHNGPGRDTQAQEMLVSSHLVTQPAPAAPYQVTDEDVQTVLDVYWAPGNSTINGETMRRALEAYEARKAAA